MTFNHAVNWSYISGLGSLALTVIIIFLKDNYKRETQKKVLEKVFQRSPEEIGDIDAKLDIDGFKSPWIPQIAAMWGVQPLFILWFLNIPTLGGEKVVIVAFILVLITLLHEFYTADKYSGKIVYQIIIASLWICLYFLNNHLANVKEQERKNPKIKELNYSPEEYTS